MKKLISAILALAMMFTLAACGAKDDNKGAQKDAKKIELPEPKANVDPEEMDWGWNEYEEEYLANQTSDMWYTPEEGKNDKNYIFFNNGHSIYKVEKGKELCSGWVSDDTLHCMPDPEYKEFDVDIVFIDDFTLYDYVSKKYYTRGDLKEYSKLFEGKKFVCKTDSERVYEFKKDGKCVFTYKGEPEDCTWKVLAQRIVYIEFESYSNNMYVYFNDDGSVKCLSDSTNDIDDAFYPEKK